MVSMGTNGIYLPGRKVIVTLVLIVYINQGHEWELVFSLQPSVFWFTSSAGLLLTTVPHRRRIRS